MPRTGVSFDDYEAECLAFLTEHFDQKGEFVDLDAFPRYQELGRDRVMETIQRFRRLNLIGFHSRSSIEILPQVFDVADQLRVTDDDAKYDIFISYASPDSALANELSDEIAKHGLTTFMSEKDIPVSSPWKQTIWDALRSSSRVLILLTPNSIERPWVLLEIGAAWGLDKVLIPAMAFVDPDEFVEPLKDIQARRIETTEQKTQFVAELVQQVGDKPASSTVDGAADTTRSKPKTDAPANSKASHLKLPELEWKIMRLMPGLARGEATVAHFARVLEIAPQRAEFYLPHCPDRN